AATGRAVAPLPRPRPRRHHPAGLQPRHGRGEPVRPAAADPGREHHRRRHPRGDQGRRRHGRPRPGVPAAGAAAGGGGVMSARLLTHTTGRILRQLRHDRRTIALMLVVPILALTLLYFMFEQRPGAFDRIALIMLGIFPFIIMFLVTSIAMLRERTSGTLERLFTTPVGRLDLLFGYGIAFGFAAAVQATVATAVTYWLLGFSVRGSLALV